MKQYLLRCIFPVYQFLRIFFPLSQVSIKVPLGHILKAEVMKGRLARALGLSYRKKIKLEGALFKFKKPGHYFFHMHGMKFPLDIVFLDSQFQVVYIAYNQIRKPPNLLLPESCGNLKGWNLLARCLHYVKDIVKSKCGGEPMISSPIKAQYVLEIDAMMAGEWGIKLGSQLKVTHQRHPEELFATKDLI